jgi:hypothetical protein
MSVLATVAWDLLKLAAIVIPYFIGCAVTGLWLGFKIRNGWRKAKAIRRVIRGEIDKEFGR